MVKNNALRLFLALGCVAGGAAAIAGLALASSTSGVESTFEVARVIDGDTIALSNGERVRLLQIDTPELGGGECYSRAARTALLRLTPEGGRVSLEVDPALDKVDRYGRLLRYVKHEGVNVNIRLVLNGAATPYFYEGDRGKYASRFIAAVSRARKAKKGLWRACPATALSVDSQVQTRTGAPRAQAGPRPIRPLVPTAPAAGGHCDPNYAEGCVPPVSYDLDCADIRATGVAPVRVVGTDIHGFDGDGDGWGCE